MRAWWVIAVVLAGCLGNGTDMPGGDQPPGSTTATGGPGDGAIPDEAEGPGPGADPLPSGSAATWFLHVVVDCTEEPCNCGSERNYMDHVDSEGDCDGHGNRPFLEPQEGFLLAETWPSTEGSLAWPAGTRLEGTLYLTTDMDSRYRLYFRLMTGSIELAQTEPQAVTVANGGFGLTYTAVPFDAVLAEAVPAGAKLRLELHLDFDAAATSYFVGYEADHASAFTLTVP